MENFIFKNKEDIGQILFGISVILCIVMLLIPISNYVINMDEHFSLALIKLTGANFWQVLMNDVHPPLYYLIIQTVYNFVVDFNIPVNPIYALKVVSIIPYMIILAVSGTVLRKKYDWFIIGLFTFSIITMSHFFFQFLIIRMYSWAILFIFLIFITFLRLIENFNNSSWILLTFFTVLASYTHNILLVTLALVYLFVLIYIYMTKDPNVNKKTQLKKWLCSAAVAVCLYIPWVFVLFYQMSIRTTSATPSSILEYAGLLTFHVTSLTQPTVDLVVVNFAAVLFLIFIVGMAYVRYVGNPSLENFEPLSGVLIYVLTLILGGILVLTTFKSLEVRFFLPVLVIFWLSASILIGQTKNKRIFCILLFVILILGTYGICHSLDQVDSIYSKALHEEDIFLTVNDSNVIIYTTPLQYTSYHQYFTNSIEYFYDNYTVLLQSDVTVENDISKILRENPEKEVYIFASKKPKFTEDIAYEKVNDRGGSVLYKLTLNETN